VGFIKDKKKQISKSFTMYAVEGGGNGGTVMLKLVRPASPPMPLQCHVTLRCAGAEHLAAPRATRRTSFRRARALPSARWLLRRRRLQWTWASTRLPLWMRARTTW